MSELKPCPFCGGAAHFFKITDLDDRNFGGDGICCGSCPVTTDLMFSLMEDCKPKLAEAWNRREQPAQVVPLTHVLVPVDEPTDEMIDAACAAVDGMYRVDFVRAYVAAFAHLKAGYRDESYWCGWNAAIKSQQAEAVPPGYVLVPVEPTEAMLEAGKTAHYEAECRINEPGAWDPHGFASRKVRVAHVYRAMLAAAQGEKP